MANELVVVETIKEVSEAVKTIVGTYRETRIVRVTQKNILKERLEAYRKLQRGNAICEISRNNIEQIAKTFKLIESYNFSGAALEAVMRQFEIQSKGLERLLEDFTNEF